MPFGLACSLIACKYTLRFFMDFGKMTHDQIFILLMSFVVFYLRSYLPLTKKFSFPVFGQNSAKQRFRIGYQAK